MSRRISIRDFIESGMPATVSDEDGDWAIRIDGNRRLSPDGIARWSDSGALDQTVVVDGNGAIVSIMDDGLEKEVCALFNTLAGNVNDSVFSKYVVQRRKRKGSMDIKTEEIGKCITALEGLLDEGSRTDGEDVMEMLTRALADELLASYQYWVCKNLARGAGRVDVIPEFDQHEKDERDHADKLMLRIKELGGVPIYDPADWAKVGNPWTVVSTTSVCEQLDITIQAEQDAIDYYNRMIGVCKGRDEVTMRLCRSILSDECEHLYDLKMLKEDICG